jgi:hypothetical protein
MSLTIIYSIFCLRGQTNFIKMLWKFQSVYDPKLQFSDHRQPIQYEMTLPPAPQEKVNPKILYILQSKGRQGRAIDDSTERFVDETRMGAVQNYPDGRGATLH